MTPSAGGPSLTHPLGARLYALQHWATPMMSPGQSTQFKVCTPPDQENKTETSPTATFSKKREGWAVWHSACLLCHSVPLVCAWRPLYDYCSFPMHYTRPQSMCKGGPALHNATPRLPFLWKFLPRRLIPQEFSW